MSQEERLGRYLLHRRIASGGMAEIFLAEQMKNDGTRQICCVKRMLPELSDDTSFVEMFLDEARVCARLSHPGIAQILDFGKEDGSYFLAMEYVDGASLHVMLDVCRERRVLVPVSAAVRLVSLAATALDYAHHAKDDKGTALKIIHRDISPHNIMLSSRGDVKLIDFGIAKAAGAIHRTAIGALKGKFAYMAPEQLHHGVLDQRADIYSLGLVLYELLAGVPAVTGASHAALLTAAHRRAYAPLSRVRPDVPPAVQKVLDRALALGPDERYASAGEMGAVLEDYLTSEGLTVKPSHLVALLPDPERETAPEETHTSADMDKTTAERPARISQTGPPVGVPMGDDDLPATLPPTNRQLSELPTPIASFPVSRSFDTLKTDPVRELPDIVAAMARPPKNAEGSVPPRRIVEAQPVSKPLVAEASVPPRRIIESQPVSKPTVDGSLPLPSRTVQAPIASPTADIVMPTDPVRDAPDIKAAVARPPRSNPSALAKPPQAMPDITPLDPPPRVERRAPKKKRRTLSVLLVVALAIIVAIEVIALTGAVAPLRAMVRERFGDRLEKMGLGPLIAP